MKVLQINATINNGSTGYIVQSISEFLDKNNIESFIASPDAVTGTKTYKIGCLFDHKFHALLSRITGKQGFYSRHSTKKLIKHIEKINPDIIHLHNLHSNYINLPLLFAFLENKNVVITLHDFWFLTGKCFHFYSSNCSKWKTECNNCPRKLKDIKNYFFDSSKFVFNKKNSLLNRINSLYVVGVSNWVTNQARMSFLKNACFKTIYNGVDTNIFNRKEKLNNLNKKTTLLGFSKKWELKENETIVDLLFRIAKNNDYEIVLIGKSKFNDKFIKKYNYINDKNKLRTLYQSCSLFVNLSHEDTMSLVTVESYFCGTPIIGFESTALKETIKNCDGDFIVNPNYESLDRLIKKMVNKGCNKTINETFTKESMCKNYLSLYEQIIEDSKKV